MNVWRLIQRVCLILTLLLLAGIVASFFRPLIQRQKDLRAREDALRQDIQRQAEYLRLLKLKQAKLQEDPHFIEKIAREDLGYAKPGETIFRFMDEEQP
ncbi:MAG: septum formation initiator family protein [Kiritimatiellae bacterium]|jgi:cell division protein FtsB|nr:septum formation initiator family protein [Kiritimatiellia bacterium]NLD90533.1 septum formation initiator family protein [Lentisphaerota bacterium]HPC19673.1 septum formation initiator family protein [Kiritimatiellia bacterium]HQN79950.1 septum formation initiator family protein [Kiritimatiellia bacterium]HQQ60213.1 septum formation initiator family protein [Kiritimatiellia bacterium]